MLWKAARVKPAVSRAWATRWRRIGYALVLFVFLLWLYNVVTSSLVARADRLVPRNPETGIMVGAEARDLGPEEAPCAALFVHGFAGAANNFASLPDRLAARGWRVRVMRLPGHGTSPRELARQTVDDYLGAMERELKALRAHHEKVVLIGHSMGGALCTILASREAVDGLVLGASYFGITYYRYYVLPPETWTKLTRPFIGWVYKGQLFLQVNRKDVKDQILSYEWLPTRASVTLSEIGRLVNRPEVLGKVTCPVLMLHARGDVAASPEAAERAFNAMAAKNKRLVWLERSNHHIFWDYDAEQVISEVLQFSEQFE